MDYSLNPCETRVSRGIPASRITHHASNLWPSLIPRVPLCHSVSLGDKQKRGGKGNGGSRLARTRHHAQGTRVNAHTHASTRAATRDNAREATGGSGV